MLYLFVSTLINLLFHIDARSITFINSCQFSIGVEKGDSQNTVVCTLDAGATCAWPIPDAGWTGRFYRENTLQDSSGYPSATLAEFNLAKACTTDCAWNYDWFDISIIPPGCSGSILSYAGCVSATGADGYDVGMEMKPLACTDKTRICLNKPCDGAYGYPTDDSKTTACTVLGDWEVTFCPPGSFVDLTGVVGGVTGDGTVDGSIPSGLSAGGIAGIVIGVLLGTMLLVALVMWIRMKKVDEGV